VLGDPLRLRITLTGGPGPLGSERGAAGPTLVVALAAMRSWAPTAKAVVVPWTRNERAATAGLKTTSYADNVVALARAKAAGGTEALMANTAGDLCEGTGSNVFLVLDGQLVTPPLSSGCLAGVTRALVLEWTGAVERDLPMVALQEASEVFLTEPLPVRQRLREMLDIDLSRSGEVGHGAGDLQRAIEPTSRECERIHGRRKESSGVGGQQSMAPHERPGQMSVARHADPRVPDPLSFVSSKDASADDVAPLSPFRTQ